MHSVDFWTREQILCVSKVDETKAMCARKAFCLFLYLPKQSKVEKSNLTLPHQHPSSSTVRRHNSTFQGKDADQAICQSRFCCPRAVTSGGRFVSLRKPHCMLQQLAHEKPLSFDMQAALLHQLGTHTINTSRGQLFLWNQLCPPFGRSHHFLIIRNCSPLLIILIVSAFKNRTLALEKNSLETKTGILNHPYLFNKSFH